MCVGGRPVNQYARLNAAELAEIGAWYVRHQQVSFWRFVASISKFALEWAVRCNFPTDQNHKSRLQR